MTQITPKKLLFMNILKKKRILNKLLATGTTALMSRDLISRHSPTYIFQTHSLRVFFLFEQPLLGKHGMHCLTWQTRMDVFLEIFIQLAGFVYGLATMQHLIAMENKGSVLSLGILNNGCL